MNSCQRLHREVVGQYVFGENGNGQIWAMDPASPGQLTELLRLPGEMRAYGGLSSFAVDAEQELYLCILGDNQRATGSLQKLVTVRPGPPVPATLSATGLFQNTRALTPAPRLFAYEINAPFWSDHADKRRWIALPAGARIGFAERGDWSLPAGTVAVKHFELAVDERDPGRRRRLETRVLVLDGRGGAAGRTYKWRADGADADLVEFPLREHLTAISAVPFFPDPIPAGAGGRGPLRLVPRPDRPAFHQVREEGDFDVAARWEDLGSEASGLIVERASAAPGSGDASTSTSAALFWESSLLRGRRLVVESGGAGAPERRVMDGVPGPWLRLARKDRRLRSFAGEDGVRWTLLAETNWPSGTARVGPFARGGGPSSIASLVRCRERDHHYPEPSECGSCHLQSARHLLGTSTRQWNRPVRALDGQTLNQLVLAGQRGLLDVVISPEAAAHMDRLVPITDTGAPLAARVRSYLDANCSYCHRPGVVTQVAFDARYDIPLAEQGLLHGRLRWPSVPRPRDFLVLPGDARRSEIHRQLAAGRMPPLGTALVDHQAADLLATWIDGLALP